MTSRLVDMEQAYNERKNALEQEKRAREERRKHYDDGVKKRLESLKMFFEHYKNFIESKGFLIKSSDNGRRYDLYKKDRNVLTVHIEDEKFKFGKSFVPGPSIDVRHPDELTPRIAEALAEFDASVGES